MTDHKHAQEELRARPACCWCDLGYKPFGDGRHYRGLMGMVVVDCPRFLMELKHGR